MSADDELHRRIDRIAGMLPPEQLRALGELLEERHEASDLDACMIVAHIAHAVTGELVEAIGTLLTEQGQAAALHGRARRLRLVRSPGRGGAR